jgi:integral membrane sensor domain MASE1
MILVLAIIYMLSARLELMTAYFLAKTSPFCIPTGIGSADLFILYYRYATGITLGVLLGSLSRPRSSS